ncbi:hypothetical protein IT413_02525 [Candidatus Peregrinibacteria bacterium]|nr:hypothetical protein [Candidatus Peregrinibacteria bacterium]
MSHLDTKLHKKAAFTYALTTATIAVFVSACSLLYSYIFTGRSFQNLFFSLYGVIFYFGIGLCTGIYMSTLQKDLKTKLIFILCTAIGSALPMASICIFTKAGPISLIFFLAGCAGTGLLLSLTLRDVRAAVVLSFLALGGLISSLYLCSIVFSLITPNIPKIGNYLIIVDLYIIFFNFFYSFFMGLSYYLIYKETRGKLLSARSKITISTTH